MSIILVFVASISGIAIWWLSQQRLASKPWLETGVMLEKRPVPSSLRVAKIGLGFFLTVVCAMLAMLISAFFMRIGPDWRPMPEPMMLWVNTAVLVCGSVAMQRGCVAARRGQIDKLKGALLAAGVLSFIFLLGQLAVWRQLNEAGYFPADNPATAFFYLLTAVHGVHLLGGLLALGRIGGKAWRGVPAGQLRLGAELCTIYWHFLLAVWVVLFGLLLLTSRYVGIAQILADLICGVSRD